MVDETARDKGGQTHPITTEIYVIPWKERYVIYAPLRRIAFIGNAATVNFIHNLRGGGEGAGSGEEAFLEFLRRIRLVGDQGDVPITIPGRVDFKPTEVTLFLTSRCNLRCIYCYASAGSGPRVDMTMATARRGIDFVHRNALESGRQGFGVGYHGGGEPSVNWEVLCESLDYARGLASRDGMKVNASIATNGLLSGAKRQWVIDNMQSVSLSVDGLPDVQDMQRPARSGRPSSSSVFQTMEAFERANFPYGIRMTTTSRSAQRLPESIAYLLEHGHPRRIQVEPVYNLGRGQAGDLQVAPRDFVAGFREARLIADAHEVEFFYSAARIDVLTDRFCQSCGDGFNLTPGGKVSACYEVCDESAGYAGDFIFGHFDAALDRYVFDDARLRRLREHRVENIPWCQGCFCKWHCAGDCPHKDRYAAASGEFAGHSRCKITRALVLDQILEKINRNGGEFWAGN